MFLNTKGVTPHVSVRCHSFYFKNHLHLCDGATYYTEVCEEEMLYNRGLNRWAYKTAYFAPYISSIHIKPYRPLFRSLVIKPRFADAAFCLLR